MKKYIVTTKETCNDEIERIANSILLDTRDDAIKLVESAAKVHVDIYNYNYTLSMFSVEKNEFDSKYRIEFQIHELDIK